jgi:hypothetical protein
LAFAIQLSQISKSFDFLITWEKKTLIKLKHNVIKSGEPNEQ